MTETIQLGQDTLLLGLYEAAIEGCQKLDTRQSSAAIVELIGALDFTYEDAAFGLFRLYDYCLRQIKGGEFGEVAGIMAELRDAWTNALAPATAVAS
jgi:flagellar protein FliS